LPEPTTQPSSASLAGTSLQNGLIRVDRDILGQRRLAS
jgi:hypothetical protein